MVLLEYKQQNRYCGALYRMNDPVSSTNELQGNYSWGGVVPIVLHINQLQSMGLLSK